MSKEVFVYLVYGWDRYYPTVADRQVIDVVSTPEMAIAMVDELKEKGERQYYDYAEFPLRQPEKQEED